MNTCAHCGKPKTTPGGEHRDCGCPPFKVTPRDIERMESPEHAQRSADFLTGLEFDQALMIPPAAWAAYERIVTERASAGVAGPVWLCLDIAPGAPRRAEWSIVVDGVVVASSQPHRVGRRRSA